uniref:Uncharacterized protein n=1 Tax=Romanomermis culicivorax TaxID=13658 RepID=A0A915KWF1_ROMCU
LKKHQIFHIFNSLLGDKKAGAALPGRRRQTGENVSVQYLLVTEFIGVKMESRAVDRLLNLLSSPSAYLRDESIDHLVQLSEETSCTNLGLFLDKIRRSILKNAETSWETRVAAAKCVEKLFRSNPVNEKYPEESFESKIKPTNLDFELQKMLNSGLILAASSSCDEIFTRNNVALAEQRRKFDQQLNGLPGFKLDTTDWVSDSDFDCPKMTREHDIDHPAKVSKLIFPPNIDQLEKILISSSNFGEIFKIFYDLVLNDILNASWTIRHACSLQLKILTRFLRKFIRNGDDLSSILSRTFENLLICISCDNFNDFVDGSKVVAPVRETVAQVFAQCVALCDFDSFGSNIVDVCRQFFGHFDDSKWKTLHSGLLLAKYLLPTIFAQNPSSFPDSFEDFLVDICK